MNESGDKEKKKKGNMKMIDKAPSLADNALQKKSSIEPPPPFIWPSQLLWSWSRTRGSSPWRNQNRLPVPPFEITAGKKSNCPWLHTSCDFGAGLCGTLPGDGGWSSMKDGATNNGGRKKKETRKRTQPELGKRKKMVQHWPSPALVGSSCLRSCDNKE